MVIRRIIAGFCVFLFVAVSIPTFFIYAISKTYFNGNFYENSFAKGYYDYFIIDTSRKLFQSNKIIQNHFKETDLKNELGKVLTIELFQKIAADFGKNIDKLKANPNEPIVFSLKTFRESLLTVANNLAFQLFKNLPSCQGTTLPEVNQEGIPTCIPKGIDYSSISAPLSKEFEQVVNKISAEQVQIDLTLGKNGNNPFYYIFAGIDQARTVLLITMLIIAAAISIIIYKPFDLLILFESLAFLISGIIGLIVSFFGQNLALKFLDQKLASTDIYSILFNKDQSLVSYLLSFVTIETQKIALIFLILGFVLFLVQFFLKKRHRA